MIKQEYYKLLKDPRWQKKRLEVMERDEFTCQLCGQTERTLHIHHLKYFKNRNPWEIDNKFLLTLCELCHEEEGKRKLIKNQQPLFLIGRIYKNGSDYIRIRVISGIPGKYIVRDLSLANAENIANLITEMVSEDYI